MDKICRECGGPSKKTYCSKVCATRWFRKSATYKKNKCLECGKPCSNMYCSYKCKGKTQIKEYKEICLNCGKEFIYHKISYKNRGQMKYCSSSCSNAIYYIEDSFFTHNPNIPLIYETIGFIFASGFIFDYQTFEIEIRTTDKERMDKFVSDTKSTFPVQYHPKLKEYRTAIRCRQWIEYLSDIGFGHSLNKHIFPIILTEYKMDFVKGYIQSRMADIYPKKDYKLIVIKAVSYPLIREIAHVTGGDLITKHNKYHCIIRDKDNTYLPYSPSGE